MAHPKRRNRPDWGGFFVPSRIWPFLGDLRGFRGPGGTTYHPRRKSVLNRRNAKNNLFWPKLEKNIEKSFGN